jgi:hypothetical protein
MKVAILQSNYLPWKGYFDLIASCDKFILFDHVQYTKNDWRNRNLIKSKQGLSWITIPTGQNINRAINEVYVNNVIWKRKHLTSFICNYSKAKHFHEIYELIKPLYLTEENHLSTINQERIQLICDYLNIKTKISTSTDYEIRGETKNEVLKNICLQAGASIYLSGPSAKSYIEPYLFSQNNISLEWMSYTSYPSYPQLWGTFNHHVSIIDLLFNCGMESRKFMLNQK